MTNTLTISRELAERLLSYEWFNQGGTQNGIDLRLLDRNKLRALLAAPVVERQEPVAYAKFDAMRKLAEDSCKLCTSPLAPVAVVLPRYTCIGKGGEYELLGSAIGAGTLKDMSAIPVYRDTTTGQLFVRTPLDFATRMDCLDKVKEMNR